MQKFSLLHKLIHLTYKRSLTCRFAIAKRGNDASNFEYGYNLIKHNNDYYTAKTCTISKEDKKTEIVTQHFLAHAPNNQFNLIYLSECFPVSSRLYFVF